MKRQMKIEENGRPSAKRQKMATDPSTSENMCTPKAVSLSTLNVDCLKKIVDYLSIDDLFNMYIADNQLQSVLQYFVSGRMFDFDELADCCHILDLFKIFGQHMTKIKIGERNIQYKNRRLSKIDEILRLITTYCSEGGLKHLEIQYFYASCIDKHVLDASIPFFRCVEKFKIFETDHNSSVDDIFDSVVYFHTHPNFHSSLSDFVERVVENAVNINSIEITNLRGVNCRFFHLDHVRNLKNLSLSNCNVQEPDGLVSFIQKKPKLLSFGFMNSSLRGMDSATSTSTNSMFELVANNIAHLEALDLFPNVGYINGQNKYEVRPFTNPDLKHLAKFKNLKILTFAGITGQLLKVLTQQNTVERLNGSFSTTHNISADLNFLQNFRSLKVIQIHECSTQHTIEFAKLFLSELPNLTECHFNFKTISEDVIKKAVESAINLSILSISYTFGRLRTAMYLSLLRLRLRHGEQDNPLVIYVDKTLLVSFLTRLGRKYKPKIITLMPSEVDAKWW